MNIPKEVIIIGGGTSIQEGISLGLKDKIKDKFVITLNYAYRYFDHTFMCFCDKDLYNPSQDMMANGKYKDLSEELKKLPLIIGQFDSGVDKMKYSNTVLLRSSGTYNRQKSIEKGIYKPCLCGIFALTLTGWLLDFKGTIYLLGYDWSRGSVPTHFYNDLNHRGVGYTRFYDRHNPIEHFKPFLAEKELQILNVSPNSNIDCFNKISYTDMFTLLNNDTYNQLDLRETLKERIKNALSN